MKQILSAILEIKMDDDREENFVKKKYQNFV